MDAGTIFELKRDKMLEYSRMHTGQLMQSLEYKEFVDIESKKDILFEKRIEFICLAKSLHASMLAETGYTQMKRFLKAEYYMDNDTAGIYADNYNLAHRVFEDFDKIVTNCEKYKIVLDHLIELNFWVHVNLATWIQKNGHSLYNTVAGAKYEHNKSNLNYVS